MPSERFTPRSLLEAHRAAAAVRAGYVAVSGLPFDEDVLRHPPELPHDGVVLAIPHPGARAGHDGLGRLLHACRSGPAAQGVVLPAPILRHLAEAGLAGVELHPLAAPRDGHTVYWLHVPGAGDVLRANHPLVHAALLDPDASVQRLESRGAVRDAAVELTLVTRAVRGRARLHRHEGEAARLDELVVQDGEVRLVFDHPWLVPLRRRLAAILRSER